jgi:hypothetical protein
VAQGNPRANVWPRLVLRPTPASRKTRRAREQDPQPRTAEQSGGQNRPVIKTRMKENKNLRRYCSDLRNKTMGEGTESTDSSRNKELKPAAKHKLGRV